MYLSIEALVLKAFDLKETDQLLTLFSREMGKIPVVAKGVKKAQSSLRGLVQPFCHSQFYLTPSGELHLITQGKINEFFGNIREDLNKTLQAMYILELLDKSTVDRDPNQALFNLALQVLRHIENSPLSSLSLRYFEIKLVHLLGLAPVLDRCTNCGRAEDLVCFSRSNGGVLCRECAPQFEVTRILPPVLGVFRTLQQNGLTILSRLRLPDSTLDQLEAILEGYLEYHLERKLNIKHVIRDLNR